MGMAGGGDFRPMDACWVPSVVQIVGRRFDDVGVLKVGTTLESARRWSGCHPTI